MEYAILSAIAAMNEPKTCSTTALKKYVLENHPGTNSNYQSKSQRCVHLAGAGGILLQTSVVITDWGATKARFYAF